MRILLIGYGKMGKAIEAIAAQRGHSIVDRIEIPGDQWTLPNGGCDVAIEFTHPESAVGNLIKCAEAGIPVVCGTTGWLANKDRVHQKFMNVGGAFFYASNYSLGVNVFFKVNEYLAQLMAGRPGYEVSIDETHHTQKKDAPSGTAISLAEGIIAHSGTKTSWALDHVQRADQLVIRAHRVDPAPGTHVVTYHSEVDDLQITHTAHSRQGFALGAVLAAEWLPGRKGVFGMDDLLKF